MEKAKKKYEELTITDDFMFGKVMRDPGRCRKLLEIILGVKIQEVVFLEDQNSLNPDYNAKGIRLDIYLEDAQNTVYNVEMQTEDPGVLPSRSRYYQSVIDINLIEKGAKYKELKKSYVIFICTFDLFGRGRHIYHFENCCKEEPGIRLEDGMEKIFLNTKGNLGDVSVELQNLLRYFESRTPQDDYTRELEEAVISAREHRDWRREYMKLTLWEQDIRDESRKEGMEIKLVSLVCSKLAKGKTLEVIAEELEEEPDEIRHIVNTAVKYAPDYEIEEIWREIMRR